MPATLLVPDFLFKEMVKFIFSNSLASIELYRKFIQNIESLTERNEIMKSCHESLIAGHPGRARTLNRIRLNFYWDSMKKDVENFVNRCVKCNVNKAKNRTTKIPLKLTSCVDQVFDKFYIDNVGPLPVSYQNNRFLLTAKCELSKFIFAVAIEDLTSEVIAKALVEKVFLQSNFPRILVADNAHSLNSQLMKKLQVILQIKTINCSIFHPQSNQVERFHRDLGDYLRNFIEDDPQSWENLLPFAVFSYNTAINSSTGFMPYELVYGKKPNLAQTRRALYTFDDYVSNLRLILDRTRAIAKENLIAAKEKQKRSYDKKLVNFELKAGDFVFMKNNSAVGPKKFQQKFKGPFLVKKILNDENILIVEKNKEKVVHKNLLTKYNQ